MNLLSPTFTTAYVISGLTEIPKFAGIVQGVVVQMMNFASSGTTPFASLIQSSHKWKEI